jgi:phenylalanyl-tRNA synthetase beta chain
MKVSLNWLKSYIQTDKNPEEIADILTSIGLEVEGMEVFETVKGGLKGIVVGEVLTYERLDQPGKTISLTTVNVGRAEPLQIICGAANITAKQKVWVAVPGTSLFPNNAETAFVIGERKTYGHLSQGMVCAEDELNLGQSHAGIMVLDEKMVVGTPAASFYKVESDTIIEVGLTPNRSDATCHRGIAQDLAACLKVRKLNFSETEDLRNGQKSEIRNPKSEIKIRIETDTPRYAGVVISNISVKESPEWLKNRLRSIGVRPINNVVDATNFILHDLGQPLHAFDFSEIKGDEIIVKCLPEGTIFKSLDGQDRKLFAEDVMICDGESNPMCIGGVFGGENSGVKSTTTTIFLESAHFSAKAIRKSMIRHNLRTDAAKIFEKGSDPNLCVEALQKAAALICELSGGEIASETVDIYPKKVEKTEIVCQDKDIEQLIGMDFTRERLKEILAALQISVENENQRSFTAVVPTNKSDVKREADIAEEILRMLGTDNIPLPGTIKMSLEVTQKPDSTTLKYLVSDQLVAAGLSEIMALSLTNSAYFGHLPVENLVFVNNTANQGLDVLRPSMLFGGLETIRHNQNRQQPDLKLFEFGKIYQKNGDDYGEQNHLALFLTGARFGESWQKNNKPSVDFYTLKSLVINVLARLGAAGGQETVFQNDEFQNALRIHRGPKTIVEFGQIKPSVLKKMDVKNPVFYADFHWDNLLDALKNNRIKFQEIGKYPTVRRDLALVVEQSVGFGEIKQLAQKTAKKLLKEINLFDVFESIEKLGAGKKSCAVSFIFEDTEKTLAEKEIEETMANLQSVFEKNLGAVVRS